MADLTAKGSIGYAAHPPESEKVIGRITPALSVNGRAIADRRGTRVTRGPSNVCAPLPALPSEPEPR